MSKKYILNKGFITQKIGQNITIFSGEESVLYTLNGSATFVFNGLKSGWDREKIVQKMQNKYKLTQKQAEKDFDKLLKDLLKKKIFRLSS